MSDDNLTLDTRPLTQLGSWLLRARRSSGQAAETLTQLCRGFRLD